MDWLIYGANGYTGRLIAQSAVDGGLRPRLAGRSAAVVDLAQELDLHSSIFDLSDAAEVRRHISGAKLVLHCAGPFSRTSALMVQACIDEGVHYLDITGEIAVFAAVNAQAAAARRADVALVPGTGFDVVPSDCLAAALVGALPAATELSLAFASEGGPSPGTAKTAIEGMAEGGKVLRDGRITTVPLAWKTREIPFHDKPRMGVTIPWGDVYTAHISTGVPDVEVYMAMPPGRIRQIQRIRWLRRVFAVTAIQRFAQRRVDASVQGPSRKEREAGGMELWGEVRSADGRTAAATMSTPNGYDITASASLGIARYLLEHDVEGGFYTPSLLMGADYAASLPGVTLRMNVTSV